ncbi:MAG: GNAT family N-acetyltransferase [Acutalibacter sp.]|nr:GNAT family N-acetyltransferase [Acutalibacter sp.]
MSISLSRADLLDAPALFQMQQQAFLPLLLKYQDYTTNPAAEPLQRTEERLRQNNSEYYFILLDGKRIGGIRIGIFKNYCRVSPIFILPLYQNNGYAKQAMLMAERKHPNIRRWELETIGEEERLCHFYENLGYRQTGAAKKLSRLTLVTYEKIVNERE